MLRTAARYSLALALCLLGSAPSLSPQQQGTLQVNGATGDDSLTIAQVRAGGSWRTIGRASWGSTARAAPNPAEAARAGDTVTIAGGTYTTAEAVTSRWSPVYNPANNGTASAPITFTCVGVCVLGSPNGNAPVIGEDGKTFIRWRADVTQGHAWQIRVYGRQAGAAAATEVNTAPDTGPVVCHGGTGCWIEGTSIDGGLQTDYTDNWPGIRIEGATGFTIRDNTIRNFRNQSTSSNSAGIQIYGSATGVVENNYVQHVTTPISFKDAPGLLQFSGVHVRNNFAENFTGAAVLISFTQPQGNIRIYSNTFRDGFAGLVLARADSSSPFWLCNNTFVNVTKGIIAGPAGSGGRFVGNILATAQHMLWNDGSVGPGVSHLSIQRNVFFNPTMAFYSQTDGTRTMAQWRAAYPGQDVEPPLSIASDPRFVAPGASGLGNFRLRPGSPALGLGIDACDVNGNGNTTESIPAGAFVSGSEVMGPRR